jgi:cysteine-rich repeat protein
MLGSSAAAGACFTGQDAHGLPCNEDGDCGLDQPCLTGYCGGVMLSDTGTTTDSSTTSVGSTGDAAFCGDGTTDPRETCDDGNADNTDDCLDTCEAASCGDGFTGPGEACDDGNAVDDDECTSACALTSCGDGVVQPGESCDDGNRVDGDECLNTCLEATCGDGTVWTGMEECDDGNTADDAACLADCRAVFFWDDMELSNDDWTHALVSGTITDQWGRAQDDAQSGEWSWSSGTQPTGMVPYGDTRLETRDIDLTGIAAPVQLTFWHRYDFDDCDMTPGNEADGALVEVFTGSWEALNPTPAYNNPSLGTADCAAEPTPLAGSAGWGAQGAWQKVTVPLDDHVGGVIRIGFHVGWDCANCMESTEEGWFVDDVIVSRPIG